MNDVVVVAVDAQVDPAREAELLEGYRLLAAIPPPEGLLRVELLRGQAGAWRLQSTWRDLDSLRAQRTPGAKPPAAALLEQVGATHTAALFTVAQQYGFTAP